MLKSFKPITPSQRHRVSLNNKVLDLKKPVAKPLLKGFNRSFGRNNKGRITVRHRGGGHKRLYRQISFNRSGISGTVQQIEYDPNRSSNIALIKSDNGFSYIIAPEKLTIGDLIQSGPTVPISIGNALPIMNIPLGSHIHNICLNINTDAKLIRSAGTSAQLLQKDQTGKCKIRLASGHQRWLPSSSFATLGVISNANFKNQKIGKAGRNRWLNKRPKVRGVAMNPVDHPHGGGEGKTSGGRPSVTPKGLLTKGKPTAKQKKRYII